MIPQTLEQLLSQAQSIAGLTFGELADELHIPVPIDLKRDKGWVGMLLERALGATAGSKAEQDFSHLGVELKTLPINAEGYPLETTFVSLAPLVQNSGVKWENSHVRHKLSCVLWMPIEGSRHIPLRERHIGAPIFWKPTTGQERQLKQDWEELMDLIVLGKLEQITARIGEVMQLRPKGVNSRAVTKGIGKNGEIIDTLPLGFYLRKEFTAQILNAFLETKSL
ncbi:DNA mismatch repair endonuclease MutH [Haemophilus influenzae]|uniref:DNA mismatch repair endonuclease MutH n=1 Tax=Haemophilus influenzae TaxID=727 RepID=UPI0001A66652|nr:DNA mismatch repair endonuclease MutH [Haemophilus influenzae]CVP28239.1 Methyl-directed mismatch repair protein [Streptococcus pneumoniae]MBK1414366.1 DNA mismatch repair endonuclease MutH [Haemophilus influenzae]MCK9020840.1 DNA mismatch repair endonuclease MutH [Haemophilus influenzae]MCK9040587.1 DNA mismatch repair endonuclease MutH [Haemophilus influenzae]MCK9041774.1 DNA mismatch repair endonuclease MutH [Haemophilus influenzae]